jgi:hypothetical protein
MALFTIIIHTDQTSVAAVKDLQGISLAGIEGRGQAELVF